MKIKKKKLVGEIYTANKPKLDSLLKNKESKMAVDLTTGTYNEEGVFRQHNDDSETSEVFNLSENLSSLKNFRTTRIIKENTNEKYLVLEGCFVGDDKPAIVIVEKIPFNTKDLARIFCADSRLELKFRNNIYSNYHVYPPISFNGYNVKVIYPATEKDFTEYVDEPLMMINESTELYKSVVSPYFQATSSDKLLHKSDFKVIYEEQDSESGFTLLDCKPDSCACNDLHVRAVCLLERKDILSLRDLTTDHIPLLSQIKEKCLEKLSNKYNVPASKLLSYIHYPPDHFPFYVVFETVEKDHLIPAEKAHHLETVIFNLTCIPDYYKKVALTYSLSEKDILLKKIKAVHSNCNK